MQCVVLAGGLGTRIRSVSGGAPKALVPVLGVPFVDRQLGRLAAEGVERVVLAIGHGGELVRRHLGDGARLGVSVSYVDEGDDPRGTGGALRLALDRGALEPEFYVLYGDSYLLAPFAPVAAAFRASGLPALLSVHRNDDRWDRSNALYEDGRVVVYDKSRRDPRAERFRWIDYGLAVLSREAVARIPARTRFDLADLYHELSLAGLLGGYEVRERFYEIGSPEGLAELERFLAAGEPGPRAGA